MQPGEQLADFVHKGLRSGHSPEALKGALSDAGWSPREVDLALAAWLPGRADLGSMPIPRPRPYLSARDAVLYGMLFIALGNLVWGIGSLGWQLIDQLIADPADYYTPPASSMRFAIASLIVFGPVFWWLNRRVMRGTVADAGRARSLVRKWFASLTMILAAIALLGDLVTVVYALLEGDLTARFAAKAAWIAALAGLVIAYLRDEVDAG